ncbi:MAG TPA: transposase, partial [Candidatus Acidoferrales bacterium]|nr:transposase [Candidatus Acidoferrales bacterium]
VGMSLSNLVRHYRYRGLSITPGGFVQAFNRLAQLLKPGYDQILDRVKASAVLHADETSWRINGVTHWLWYFGTSLWSYYVIDRRRGSDVVRRVLGSILSGILICDFWAAYSFLGALAKQRCMYHLFTELAKVDLRNHSPDWASFRKKLYRLLRDAIQLAAAHQQLAPDVYQRRKTLIHARLDQLLSWPSVDHDVKRLVKRLKRHRAELFVFLDHPESVSPYNNHGEQQMRTPVLTRRVSHGNRSQRGAETQAILLSLFRSMDLQKKNPIDTILRLAEDALAGHPIVMEEHTPVATPTMHTAASACASPPSTANQAAHTKRVPDSSTSPPLCQLPRSIRPATPATAPPTQPQVVHSPLADA